MGNYQLFMAYFNPGNQINYVINVYLSLQLRSQEKQDFDTIAADCWSTIYDIGQTLNQHCFTGRICWVDFAVFLNKQCILDYELTAQQT